jgi:hypothetical protein
MTKRPLGMAESEYLVLRAAWHAGHPEKTAADFNRALIEAGGPEFVVTGPEYELVSTTDDAANRRAWHEFHRKHVPHEYAEWEAVGPNFVERMCLYDLAVYAYRVWWYGSRSLKLKPHQLVRLFDRYRAFGRTEREIAEIMAEPE